MGVIFRLGNRVYEIGNGIGSMMFFKITITFFVADFRKYLFKNIFSQNYGYYRVKTEPWQFFSPLTPIKIQLMIPKTEVIVLANLKYECWVLESTALGYSKVQSTLF